MYLFKFSKTTHLAYSRGLRSGLDGSHKETPVISEIFLACFRRLANDRFFVVSFLAHSYWAEF